LFRPAARRGGWRLAFTALSSLGGLIFGIGIAMGQMLVIISADSDFGELLAVSRGAVRPRERLSRGRRRPAGGP
jgi:hypothetical protein